MSQINNNYSSTFGLEFQSQDAQGNTIIEKKEYKNFNGYLNAGNEEKKAIKNYIVDILGKDPKQLSRLFLVTQDIELLGLFTDIIESNFLEDTSQLVSAFRLIDSNIEKESFLQTWNYLVKQGLIEESQEPERVSTATLSQQFNVEQIDVNTIEENNVLANIDFNRSNPQLINIYNQGLINVVRGDDNRIEVPNSDTVLSFPSDEHDLEDISVEQKDAYKVQAKDKLIQFIKGLIKDGVSPNDILSSIHPILVNTAIMNVGYVDDETKMYDPKGYDGKEIKNPPPYYWLADNYANRANTPFALTKDAIGEILGEIDLENEDNIFLIGDTEYSISPIELAFLQAIQTNLNSRDASGNPIQYDANGKPIAGPPPKLIYAVANNNEREKLKKKLHPDDPAHNDSPTNRYIMTYDEILKQRELEVPAGDAPFTKNDLEKNQDWKKAIDIIRSGMSVFQFTPSRYYNLDGPITYYETGFYNEMDNIKAQLDALIRVQRDTGALQYTDANNDVITAGTIAKRINDLETQTNAAIRGQMDNVGLDPVTEPLAKMLLQDIASLRGLLGKIQESFISPQAQEINVNNVIAYEETKLKDIQDEIRDIVNSVIGVTTPILPEDLGAKIARLQQLKRDYNSIFSAWQASRRNGADIGDNSFVQTKIETEIKPNNYVLNLQRRDFLVADQTSDAYLATLSARTDYDFSVTNTVVTATTYNWDDLDLPLLFAHAETMLTGIMNTRIGINGLLDANDKINGFLEELIADMLDSSNKEYFELNDDGTVTIADQKIRNEVKLIFANAKGINTGAWEYYLKILANPTPDMLMRGRSGVQQLRENTNAMVADVSSRGENINNDTKAILKSLQDVSEQTEALAQEAVFTIPKEDKIDISGLGVEPVYNVLESLITILLKEGRTQEYYELENQLALQIGHNKLVADAIKDHFIPAIGESMKSGQNLAHIATIFARDIEDAEARVDAKIALIEVDPPDGLNEHLAYIWNDRSNLSTIIQNLNEARAEFDKAWPKINGEYIPVEELTDEQKNTIKTIVDGRLADAYKAFQQKIKEYEPHLKVIREEIAKENGAPLGYANEMREIGSAISAATGIPIDFRVGLDLSNEESFLENILTDFNAEQVNRPLILRAEIKAFEYEQAFPKKAAEKAEKENQGQSAPTTPEALNNKAIICLNALEQQKEEDESAYRTFVMDLLEKYPGIYTLPSEDEPFSADFFNSLLQELNLQPQIDELTGIVIGDLQQASLAIIDSVKDKNGNIKTANPNWSIGIEGAYLTPSMFNSQFPWDTQDASERAYTETLLPGLQQGKNESMRKAIGIFGQIMMADQPELLPSGHSIAALRNMYSTLFGYNYGGKYLNAELTGTFFDNLVTGKTGKQFGTSGKIEFDNIPYVPGLSLGIGFNARLEKQRRKAEGISTRVTETTTPETNIPAQYKPTGISLDTSGNNVITIEPEVPPIYDAVEHVIQGDEIGVDKIKLERTQIDDNQYGGTLTYSVTLSAEYANCEVEFVVSDGTKSISKTIANGAQVKFTVGEFANAVLGPDLTITATIKDPDNNDLFFDNEQASNKFLMFTDTVQYGRNPVPSLAESSALGELDRGAITQPTASKTETVQVVRPGTGIPAHYEDFTASINVDVDFTPEAADPEQEIRFVITNGSVTMELHRTSSADAQNLSVTMEQIKTFFGATLNAPSELTIKSMLVEKGTNTVVQLYDEPSKTLVSSERAIFTLQYLEDVMDVDKTAKFVLSQINQSGKVDFGTIEIPGQHEPEKTTTDKTTETQTSEYTHNIFDIDISAYVGYERLFKFDQYDRDGAFKGIFSVKPSANLGMAWLGQKTWNSDIENFLQAYNSTTQSGNTVVTESFSFTTPYAEEGFKSAWDYFFNIGVGLAYEWPSGLALNLNPYLAREQGRDINNIPEFEDNLRFGSKIGLQGLFGSSTTRWFAELDMGGQKKNTQADFLAGFKTGISWRDLGGGEASIMVNKFNSPESMSLGLNAWQNIGVSGAQAGLGILFKPVDKSFDFHVGFAWKF